MDANTGSPVVGAEVVAPTAWSSSDASGLFRVAPVRLGESVSLSADGYLPAELRIGVNAQVDAALQPRRLQVWVRDAETGQPVSADVRASDNVAVRANGQEGYVLEPIRSGATMTIAAQGYRPIQVPYRGQDQVEVTLQPVYRGTVRDAETGHPVQGAEVIADGRIVPTDGQGGYELPRRPVSGRVSVLAPGYRKGELDLGQGRQLDLLLQPFSARGVYLTFFGAADPGLRGNVLHLIETTELNAVVIDVKGDRGWIAYPSAVALASKIGANERHTLPDVEEVLRALKEKGVYTIARIVVFKDDLLALNGKDAGVDVAVRNEATGEVWIDGEGLGWVDPLREATWDYNIALAREAARKGFDEVQFDYIRFPTDPGSDNAVENAVYARPADEQSRVDALVEFLRRAREELHKAGAYLSVDTFGYTCWVEGDMGIGQDLARLAPHVDYLSPMVYPSTYQAGLPGQLAYPAVVREPYEVVYQSLLRAQERVAGSGVVLRPWLQYFDDYPWATGFAYNAPQIAAQQRAIGDANASGWMFWDPTNTYQRGGFRPKDEGRGDAETRRRGEGP
ncbi:MAG: GTP-binding protein [Chloroflexi bacterium]|nr:GTP-binding protein [Chloroflexota bacterium]